MADITVQNLTKYYGDRLILKDISFDIQPGEKVAILGANGAGKTTLLNILTGRLSYDGGHVAFGQGRTAGVIDQMPDFPPESTVEDMRKIFAKREVSIPARMHGGGHPPARVQGIRRSCGSNGRADRRNDAQAG